MFSIALIILMILGFVFAIIGKLPWGSFWILAILLAICAYIIIPRIRAVLVR